MNDTVQTLEIPVALLEAIKQAEKERRIKVLSQEIECLLHCGKTEKAMELFDELFGATRS